MFALIIAILVYRIAELDKIIGRDCDDTRPFVSAINFEYNPRDSNLEKLEGVNSREYLIKLKEAISRLKKSEQNLGISSDAFKNLVKVYINMEFKKQLPHTANAENIFSFMLQKKNNLEIHVFSKQVIKLSFFVSAVLTGTTIFSSLYFLPYGGHKTCFHIVEVIKNLALFNVFIVVASVLLMTFTEGLVRYFLENCYKS